MAESLKQKLGFIVAAVMMVAALGVLNLGSPAGAQSKPCKSGGGNGTASPSPSPSESEEPFPPIPPIFPEESESSPSPTESSGEPRNCSSKISLKYKTSSKEFSGKVTSQEDACETGRQVKLKKKKKGRDRTVDTTVTNGGGSYDMQVARAKGKYYTQTPLQRVPSNDGRVNCGAAKSATIKV